MTRPTTPRPAARRARTALIALAALALVGGAAALSLMPGRNGAPRDLARGAALYAAECAACHGAALEGAPDWRRPGPDGLLPAPPHDATGHTWHHADAVLFAITKHGSAAVVGGGYESGMPGFGDALSDDEIRDVLAWIKAQWPEEIRMMQAEMTARDEAAR